MGKINKKVINIWDGGIKTSPRSSSPDTSDGAQMIKGFDVYKDSKKMIPMQSWEDFTTLDERALGIRAMGGISDTIYGVGSALKNWYGKNWQYRIRVDVNKFYNQAQTLPLHLDMSLLPNDFWTNVNSDMSDLRITDKNGNTYSVFTENVDVNAKTGDMWIETGTVEAMTPVSQTYSSASGTGSYFAFGTTPQYAYAFPVSLNGSKINSFTTSLYKVGTPTDNITIKLYSDNAGTPNVSVATLGTIPVSEIKNTNFNNYTVYFDELELTGTYWVVVYGNLVMSASDYFTTQYSSSGTTVIKYATNNTLTSWSDVDTTATPNYNFSYITDDSVDRYFYIYYGNADTQAIPNGTPSTDYPNSARQVWNNTRIAYTFGDNKSNNQYYTNNATGETEAFTTDPTFFAGLVGNSIRTYGANIQTDGNDKVGITGSSISISFLIKVSAWANITLFTDSNSNFTVALDTSGKINWTVNGTTATTTNTSTLALTLNEWHTIDCVFNDDAYIYIDGVKQTFNIDDGSYDETNTNNYLQINTGQVATIGQVLGISSTYTDYVVATKIYNFYRSDFWTVGSQETLDTQIYDGVALYQKSITSGNWEESEQSGQPVKNLNYYPVNAFIDDTGTYFIVSQEPENQGSWYMAKASYDTILDPTHLTLGVVTTNPSKVISQFEEAMGDNTSYFNFGTSAIGSIGDPGSASEQSFAGTVQSLASWRSYLAGAYTRRNRARVDLWDLATTNPIEKLDAGNGNVRVVGNVGDTLFCVVDNFIDDATKSSNKPTVEIRKYVGNGQMEKTHVLEIPAVITSYVDDWERAVSNMKLKRNTQVLFYMRLPQDSTATTFDEGFWAVGRNSKGELCLTLQIPTDGLGMPEQVFGFAQQVFFIQKDGGIKRLSDSTYSDIRLYKSLKMNEGNTNIEKKLIGVEIITEPLEANQTITLYYKKNGETSRTLIGTLSGTDEISKEFLYNSADESLGNYKEIEFEIESTGGKSAILELNYRYEYLKDVI